MRLFAGAVSAETDLLALFFAGVAVVERSLLLPLYRFSHSIVGKLEPYRDCLKYCLNILLKAAVLRISQIPKILIIILSYLIVFRCIIAVIS